MAVGGPAKMSIISSSLFGTVSGGAATNVVVDGWLTHQDLPRFQEDGHKGLGEIGGFRTGSDEDLRTQDQECF